MPTLLIRAEDKNRWERRTPVVPADLAAVVEATGARALVQRSDKRYFEPALYEAAGAALCEDMSGGDVIVGVKEIPVEKILPNKTYLFFSHTIKGQKSNMPLLQKIIDSGATLIDYEKITDASGRRLIYFGPYAGDAGAIDILSLMGEHWAAKGIDTPFSAVKRAHQYDSVASAGQHLRAIGEQIRQTGLPPSLCPFTIGILGYGNVSNGAQQIFDCLPTQRIAPDDLQPFLRQGDGNRHTVYVTVFKEQDLVIPKDADQPFDLQDYYDHPERYQSRFEKYLANVTLLVNAVYWEKRYPRFVTWAGLKRMAQGQKRPKLCGIADISCDTHGSIECNVKSTDSDMPAYRVDPLRQTIADGHVGEGIVLLAVDNLPCELPKDASTFFSNQLKPFLPALLGADYHTALENSGLPPELQRATIVHKGQLTEPYAYLADYLKPEPV